MSTDQEVKVDFFVNITCSCHFNLGIALIVNPIVSWMVEKQSTAAYFEEWKINTWKLNQCLAHFIPKKSHLIRYIEAVNFHCLHWRYNTTMSSFLLIITIELNYSNKYQSQQTITSIMRHHRRFAPGVNYAFNVFKNSRFSGGYNL